ncbi:hypothetical protein ACX80U_12005 [Arthrobacter sp. TmT3-37]
MPELWMPGAVRDPQPGGIPLNRALPPRCTWHATADQINAAGYQPPFDNVRRYLNSVAYAPTLLWDPVTGHKVQSYPADVGGRALSRWNEDGEVHIQIEVYFAAGAIRETKDGPRRLATIAETPCNGLEEILAWTDGFGIPRRWPIAEPSGGRQDDVHVWNTQAGHYAHAQVPGENHVDPGPMPPLTRAATVRELVTGLGIVVPA